VREKLHRHTEQSTRKENRSGEERPNMERLQESSREGEMERA
jgi:hypothetical protein